jgi:hypothetical protein
MRCTSPRTAFWTQPRTLYAWIVRLRHVCCTSNKKMRRAVPDLASLSN